MSDGVNDTQPSRLALENEIQHLRWQRDDLQARNSELVEQRRKVERELEWYKAVHVLVANSNVFMYAKDKQNENKHDSVFFTDCVFKDGRPGLSLNMNDVFFWGCADAEDIEYWDAPRMVELAKRHGYAGLILYAKIKRDERGEKYDAEHLRKYYPEVYELEAKWKTEQNTCICIDGNPYSPLGCPVHAKDHE